MSRPAWLGTDENLAFTNSAAATAWATANPSLVYDGLMATIGGSAVVWRDGAGWVDSVQTILDRPLRVASFGPSTADNGVGVCDMFSYSVYPGSGTTIYFPANGNLFDSIKAADKMLVACGGVSGATVDTSYSRYAATESATRKAPFDIAKKSPDVVIFRTSTINNVKGYNSAPSDATLSVLVDKELEIVDDFVARGMRVVVSPVLGYSEAVSAEILAIRRDAAARINRLFSLRSVGAAWVLVSVSAISGPDLAFFAGMSDDGVHPTSLCGKVLGIAENLFIDSWYLPSPIFGADVFDMSKLMSTNDGTLAISDISGVVSSGRVSKSTYHQFNVAAQVGGKIKFNFYGGSGSALSAAYAANTNRDVAFRFKVLDSEGVERPDVVASVYTRVTLRNAAAASIAFDATYNGYANETSTLIGVPAEAPSITQSYSEITFSEAGNFILQIFPLRIRNVAS